MKVLSTGEEFCKLAQDYNVVPVFAELSTDMETPISAYYKIVGDDVGFILESATTEKNFGRYSFIGAQPFASIAAQCVKSELTENNKKTTLSGPPLTVLKNFFEQHSFPPLTDLPPFIGGAVGYQTYESVTTFERIRGKKVPDGMIVAEYLFCRVMIIMDHVKHVTRLVYLALNPAENDAKSAYENAVNELHAVARRLEQKVVFPEFHASQASKKKRSGADTATTSRGHYIDMVNKAKDYIAAGDIFQVVLSQQFCRELNQHPFAIYRRLRQVNPSPYMFYINFGQRQLVGASPEMLVKVEDSKVLTCPIAGTRPRGKTPDQDARLAKELLADDKEKAEHAMLVDLGRNDIGRVSLPGTVEVVKMLEVGYFSHVMHLISEVTGQLDPKYTALDVLTACFPAGTLSGAPKVRAMEIIHELEQDERGFYAGAIGYIDFRGNLDACIAIRTLMVENGQMISRTGAGIVADSIPEKEYQESLDKGQALFQVMEEAEDQ
ncbi:anthranilate synthase component 1 [Sporomusaceae bacterium BoRhaA]|uniref:anthranilate synthase component I n=1 Tax=Pelorhabdus rhamnosifermentans TaxID=2772457 RepID=UPI001C05FD62|nr:anthranilate synthase component I [Pelorhabdus rhamnosifermentans]MBU2702179.1 anthranilate synthase component 1 [Pelorhabdus rhamnosifermentans]